MKIEYICEVCGNRSTNSSEIQKCEDYHTRNGCKHEHKYLVLENGCGVGDEEIYWFCPDCEQNLDIDGENIWLTHRTKVIALYDERYGHKEEVKK